MRVAIVSNTSWYLFNFRLNLMRAIQAEGHIVVAIAPEDAYSEKIVEQGFEFKHWGLSCSGVNPLVEFNSLLNLARIFHQQKIDLVLSYTPKGNLYSAISGIVLRKKFIPNVSGLGRVFIQKSLLTSIVKILYRLTFNRAQYVFFQNYDDMNVFIDNKFVRKEKSERLPGSGVDLSKFAVNVKEQSADEAEIKELTFLLVARLLRDKGVGEYVEAASIIRSIMPNVKFQLLGFADVSNPSAISRVEVDAWVAQGIVEYLGSTDDVRPFLVKADCVVLPSYREGVPRTLLEAAAMGRPVITTDAPGCRDAIIDNVTGYLCKPKDAVDLTDKLLKFIALPLQHKRSMGLQGRAFVEKNFDEKFVLKRYMKFFI